MSLANFTLSDNLDSYLHKAASGHEGTVFTNRFTSENMSGNFHLAKLTISDCFSQVVVSHTLDSPWAKLWLACTFHLVVPRQVYSFQTS